MRRLLLFASLLAAPAALHAQGTIPIRGDRLSGFVLPIEPQAADVAIKALRASAWDVDDTRRLLLDEDVEIRIGAQTFESASAVLWLNRIPSGGGLINQLAIYFESVGNPTQTAGVGVEGERLLVTASTRGAVTLDVASFESGRPRLSEVIHRGELRLAEQLRRLLAEPPALESRPQVDAPPEPDAFRPVPGGRVSERDLILPEEVALPTIEQHTPPLLSPASIVRFSAAQVDFLPGEEENVIVATGSFVVDYVSSDPREDFTQITLSAERGVLFVRPGSVHDLARAGLSAADVHGVYLEGNVHVTAADGDYRARAPRVYYDFRTAQAIMLEAVLRTYARDTRVPVYARARELRQIASNQWEARRVRVSTSEFFVPHYSIGAERMTITRRPARADPEERETYLESEDNTMRLGDVPVAFWPRFAGTARDVPLRGVSVGGSEQDGVQIQTRWDLFALLGQDAPQGQEAELRLDGFTKRGPGTGLDYRYQDGSSAGRLDLYGLYDQGTDKTSAGEEVEPSSEWRGVALAEHRVALGRRWRLEAQGSWISDETFISARREEDFESRREYETAAYLRSFSDHTAFDVLVKYALNDFISNDYLLASRSTQVDRLGDLSYRRYGDALGRLVTYTGETRVTHMRFRLEEGTPRELGVPGAAFGIGPDDRIDEALTAGGLNEDRVGRFDTRHEASVPMAIGIFKVVPFAVGRLTAYTSDFQSFSSESDDARLFGAAGVRVHSAFQRVDDSVSSRVLDLNRVRHIMEPGVTVWYGAATVEDGTLPAYDVQVESIGTGAAVNLALRNTWQTQRGGPGRWHSVDFLRIDTNVILDNDTTQRSPTPQFFDYRPEQSQFGDQVYTAALWQVSDSLALAGEQTFALDDSRIARGSIGGELRHSPVLATYVEYRYIDVSDNQLLDVGWNYRMTPKYRINLTPQWDFVENEFRAVTLEMTRSFPDVDLTFRVRYDQIKDETSVGASLELVQF